MIILFLSFVFFSLMSIIGYGLIFNKIFFNNSKNLNLGIVGFIGLFFLSSISYFTHIFTPHNFIHNLFIFILGILTFLIFYKKKVFTVKKEYIYILILLLVGIFLAKTHDDFGYYHLPNSLHFTENKLEFGLGNLNHGFKHHSSIFFLYSIFYLPIIKFYLFNVINFFFLIFAVFYLYESIDSDIKKKKFDSISLIKTIFLILFISIFNRIGEYGTDITGQLVAGTFICLLIDLVLKKTSKKIYLDNIILVLLFLVYLITIKTYFFVYLIFPLIVFFISNLKREIFFYLINSKVFIFLIFVMFLFFLINVSSTGCLIYPIKDLCFPKVFKWGLSAETINYLSTWYEIWSKGGAGPDFREKDPLIYIQGLNWFDNWTEKYFFTKVTDFLLSIILGLIITILVIKKKIYFSSSWKKNIFLIYLGIFLLALFWFFNFPSLRYGGYILIISLLIIPFCMFVKFKKKKNLMKDFKILFIISILIFNFKNISRINNELNYKAVNNFKSFPLFYVEKTTYSVSSINNQKIYVVKGMCWATPSPCLRNTNKDITTKYGYRIYRNN